MPSRLSRAYYLALFKARGLQTRVTRQLFANIPLRIRGMEIGKRTYLPCGSKFTWPHRVRIGANCTFNEGFVCREYSAGDRFHAAVQIGNDNYFDYDVRFILCTGQSKLSIGDRNFFGVGCQLSQRLEISIGSDCQLAAGCKLVDFNHGTTIGGGPMAAQPCDEARIVLEDDVWLGSNVTVLKGVTIGTGAIVGAGSVVTKSIPKFEVWAGVPARKIGNRT